MNSFITFCILFCTCVAICQADSENIQDICPTAPGKHTLFVNGFPCKNPANASASDFKSSKLNNPGDTDNFLQSSVTIVTAADFPGLNTLGISIARTDLEVDGIVLPHSHPRSSEMFFINNGVVLAGFIDTDNQLFQKVLKKGDVFVFPRGLLHFCLNAGYEFASAFSVHNSQNPGMVSISGAMFDPDPEEIKKLVQRLISVSTSEVNSCGNATLARFSHLYYQ